MLSGCPYKTYQQDLLVADLVQGPFKRNELHFTVAERYNSCGTHMVFCVDFPN